MKPTSPLKITILGCGASAGVPLIGCDCAVCTSDNPRNIRTRVSLLVESARTRILIDTSPDLRQQCLRHDIHTVDAILYTHAHADHAHGIDDLRSLNYHKQGPIPAYGDAATLQELQERFAYCFAPPIPAYGWFRPCVEPHIITPGEAFEVGDITIHPFLQEHGRVDSLGFRFGDIVYSTDVVRFPAASLPFLENMALWIVDCLREEEAPTHAHLPLSLEWIERFRPERAILTHMSHSFDYESLQATTPQNVEPAFDGMVLKL
jgi:phosphoribosyl 1,2-cyclic phosphate phosphodiesterase